MADTTAGRERSNRARGVRGRGDDGESQGLHRRATKPRIVADAAAAAALRAPPDDERQECIRGAGAGDSSQQTR